MKAVLISTSALFAGACTPSPQKVCNHAMQIESASHPNRSAESSARHLSECVTEMTSIQSNHASEYKTAARCIMNANSETDMMPCIAPLLPLMPH